MVATCGVVSVYLIYRLGKEAFSRPVGLLAALFLAVEPLHVRYSHVAVTDVPATMFGLLALLLFLRAARLRSPRTLLLGALAAGLATGTKYNLGMLFVPGVIACWYVYGGLAGRAPRTRSGGARAAPRRRADAAGLRGEHALRGARSAPFPGQLRAARTRSSPTAGWASRTCTTATGTT